MAKSLEAGAWDDDVLRQEITEELLQELQVTPEVRAESTGRGFESPRLREGDVCVWRGVQATRCARRLWGSGNRNEDVHRVVAFSCV